MMEFLTPAQAAALLQIDRKTIYALIHTGELHALPIRRAWRIPRESLAALGAPKPRGPGRPRGSLNKKKPPG